LTSVLYKFMAEVADGIFLLTIRSKWFLSLMQPPRRHFPKDKVVDIWNWLFIPMWVWGSGCMKVDLHSTFCLSDTVFISVQGHLYFCTSLLVNKFIFFHVFPYRIMFMTIMFRRQRKRKRTSIRLRIGRMEDVQINM